VKSFRHLGSFKTARMALAVAGKPV
jgi:hypothetical protein